MRKKIVECMAAAMAATVMLAGCGKDSAKEENIKEDIIEESVSEEPKEAVTEESKETSEDSQKAAIVVAQHPVSCSIEGKERATGNYPEIILSDELKGKYPKLAEYVGYLNDDWASYVKEHVANYAVWAQDSLEFYDDPVFVCEDSAWINRIDDRLVTIVTGYYEDSGGAHPNHGSSSINIDPVTGNLVEISSILADATQFPGIVRKELDKAYPGICEEVDSFYFPNEGEPSDVFQQKLEANSYSWTLDEKGLKVFFSPYEIASYAAGDLEILITPEDYPGLIQSAYSMSEPQDMDKLTTVSQCEIETVEPMSDEPDYSSSIVLNPTWKRYIKDGLQAGQDHISLTKIKEDKTDWLDTEVWAVKNGFEVAQQSYADDNYYYEPYYSRDFDYMSQCITIYDRDMTVTYHDIDLAEICNGPDEAEGRESAVTQYIRYAAIDGDVLYVEIGHQGYASEEPWSSYIVAIDLNTYEVLFRSEPLVGNGYNFKIVGDTIICGYGFTSEPDYIYLLDKHIGEKYDEIPVKSAPYQFEVKDDTLYVATYNTAYEFKINR
jgi:hypothetical protein